MIPLVDLKRQYKKIGNLTKKEVNRILQKSNYILGEEVAKFENDFANYCQTKYAVGVASGTDAILIALRCLGIDKGDEVITVANTFISTVLPIIHLGAKPVLIDIDPETYNIDVNEIEEKITKKTKAIFPVHLYGRPVEMSPLLELAKKHKLFIIEDACQAHGALCHGKKTGSFGDVACFSFYPGKNLGAYGDGGAIVTNNKKIATKAKILRDIGQEKKYHHTEIGYNSRLDTLQAAVLSKKLNYLDKWNQKRRKIASLYSKMLKKTPVAIPVDQENIISNYHLYVIRVKKRDQLLEYLKSKSIYCGIHYPIPIHLQKCLKNLGYKKGDFPITEKYAKEIISLPIFPELKLKEVKQVVSYIKDFYENNK